jgi:ribosome-binding protein aMBF1 (putative translation factor)
MPTKTKKKLVDTSYHRRRLAARLKDLEFHAEYERARAEIAQIDAIMRSLDDLREEAGYSKAELARQIGKDPASVRRLFTAQVNPELKTIAALAQALGAEIQIVPRGKGSSKRKEHRRAAAG